MLIYSNRYLEHMERRISEIADADALKLRLSRDPILNSGFLSRVFRRDDRFALYATGDLEAVVAIQESGAQMIFAGDWAGLDIPAGLLPEKGVFVSASPPSAIEMLKRHYELAGEWPCWLFLAPDGYGSGPWDELGPIRPDEVSYIAPFWELGDDDREEHIRHSVENFDSACLRLEGMPVSWCGLHFYFDGVGNLGFAHTLAEHRRKGYSRLVTRALVNMLHRKGGRATADVIKDNTASILSCRANGFEAVGEQTWADFRAR
jgi:RimJ/RimL family protein N-acetyltransferase